MSIRATTRRGKLVWLVQVIRGGGSFNRRRYLDRRVFRKADAEAVEAELLAEYAAVAHNHEERGGARKSFKARIWSGGRVLPSRHPRAGGPGG